MSYAEWGRTMIQFGKEMRGESYYAVAHGAEGRYVQYRKWARTHLERKSVLGKDFIKYLAVKEHYFGTYEDDMYYRAERIAQAKAKAAAKAAAVYAPAIPGTNRRRQYLDVAEYSSLDDPWNYDLFWWECGCGSIWNLFLHDIKLRKSLNAWLEEYSSAILDEHHLRYMMSSQPPEVNGSPWKVAIHPPPSPTPEKIVVQPLFFKGC